MIKGKRVSVRYYYMDAKRHPSPEDVAKAAVGARKAINSWRPNVVIACDDIAQQYVAKEYLHDPRLKIIFCGVNAAPEHYGYDQASNVTGVLERVPASSVREALRVTFYPARNRIIHIADDSESSTFVTRELHGYSWQPFEMADSVLCRTFDDWKAAVTRAQGKDNLLLISHYHTIRRSESAAGTVPPKEIMEWTLANSHIPAVGLFGFFVQDGGAVSYGLSSFEQGTEAARMALEISCNGKKPTDIPIIAGRQFMISARESELKREGIELPVIYENFARASNKYYP